MRAWVFARRSRARPADLFAEKLRAEGVTAGRADPRHYHGEVYADADVIYHDGGNARLVYVHEQAGIRCEYVDFEGKIQPHPEPGYTLEYNAPWWSIYDETGAKVGKSTREEARARERLATLTEGLD